MRILKFDFVTRHAPLGELTWFGLGGRAEYLATPRSVNELGALVRRCSEIGVPLRVLGKGSNVLVGEDGVEGVVVRLSSPAFTYDDISGTRVLAGAGLLLQTLVSRTVRCGLGGLETLTGIPGTLGGALRGNSGTREGEIAGTLSRLILMTTTGEVVGLERRKIQYGYRKCQLDEGMIIIAGEFILEPIDHGWLVNRRRSLREQRKRNQPRGERTVGCVFKNPDGISAGELIEKAGLKGVGIGGAHVSDVHANFIIAKRGASTTSVLQLMGLIRREVSSQFGVILETEVVLW
jgi:UDP-N-acetylmuramate dehydrogenase